jgi:hypothetical protein
MNTTILIMWATITTTEAITARIALTKLLIGASTVMSGKAQEIGVMSIVGVKVERVLLYTSILTSPTPYS